MSLSTITFDDEYSGSDNIKQKASPKPPPKTGGAMPLWRQGIKRPLPKRINSNTQYEPDQINTEFNSTPTKNKQQSPTLNQKQDLPKNTNISRNPHQNKISDNNSDSYYDDYYDEFNDENVTQIPTKSPQKINATRPIATLNRTNRQSPNQAQEIQPKQGPKIPKQKKETQYSESYSYGDYESDKKMPPNQITSHKSGTVSEPSTSASTKPLPKTVNTNNTTTSPSTNNNTQNSNNDNNINTNHSNNNNISDIQVDNNNNSNTKPINFENGQNIVTLSPNLSIKKVLNDPVCYRLTRSNTVSFHGKMTHYQLYQGGRPVLHTKLKSAKTTGVCYVGEHDVIHFSSKQYFAAILYANNRTTFSIRKNNEYGEEIMTILFRGGTDGSPRSIHIFFPTVFKDIPQVLLSRKPSLTSNNSWSLEMKGKFTIKSIKNCVLVDENDNEYAYVMKIEKDTLAIEVDQNLSDLMVFAIGLSSFFCKL